MASYDSFHGESTMGRQRDVVLSINEFCFLQNKTNGSIKSHVGPLTMTISAQEALVVFDEKTKKFTEVSDFERAKQELIKRNLEKSIEKTRIKEMEEQKMLFENNKSIQDQFDIIFKNDYTLLGRINDFKEFSPSCRDVYYKIAYYIYNGNCDIVDEKIIEKLPTFNVGDFIMVKGIISTRDVVKRAQCPKCGTIMEYACEIIEGG